MAKKKLLALVLHLVFKVAALKDSAGAICLSVQYLYPQAFYLGGVPQTYPHSSAQGSNFKNRSCEIRNSPMGSIHA